MVLHVYCVHILLCILLSNFSISYCQSCMADLISPGISYSVNMYVCMKCAAFMASQYEAVNLQGYFPRFLQLIA